MPGSPSGRGLLSYKQKQWSSILHPGTKFCAPVGNQRKKKAGWQPAAGCYPARLTPECQVRTRTCGSGLLNRNTLGSIPAWRSRIVEVTMRGRPT